MAKSKKSKKDDDYMKKETVMVVALVAVVAGFLGGIIFSALNSGPGQTVVQGQAPTPQAPQQSQGPTQQQANQIMNLEREVTANPSNVEAWTQLGHVYFDTGRHSQAIRAYNKSLELRPDDANVLTDLGVMYRRNGEPSKAIEAFDKAIVADPNHGQSRFNKGIVLMYDFNDKPGAVAAWEELEKVNPNYTLPNGQTIRQAIDSL